MLMMNVIDATRREFITHKQQIDAIHMGYRQTGAVYTR